MSTILETCLKLWIFLLPENYTHLESSKRSRNWYNTLYMFNRVADDTWFELFTVAENQIMSDLRSYQNLYIISRSKSIISETVRATKILQ